MKLSYIKNSFMKTLSFMSDSPDSFVKHPGIDFIRKRKCSLADVLLCLITMSNHSLTQEIRNFFPLGDCSISKSAFCQQREKLNEEALPYLLAAVNNIQPFRKTFRGYHIMAVDGSDINIPPLKGSRNTLVKSNTEGVNYHQMHINALYDVLEERYVDLLVQPRAEYDEREAFLSFVDRNPVRDHCIYVADRGYFSKAVLAHLFADKQPFVLRIKSPEGLNSFFGRFDLPDSREFDLSLDFEYTRSRKKVYASRPDRFVVVKPNSLIELIPPEDKESAFPIHVRLVKIPLPDGRSEYLLTNLTKEEFSSNDLKEVYHLRWGIETSFRFLKYNISLNHFHSIRRDFILQEIYAKVIFYNLTRLMINCVRLPEKPTKYRRKVSFSDAVDICRTYLISTIKEKIIRDELARHLTDIRPDRSFPRKIRSKRFVPLCYRS